MTTPRKHIGFRPSPDEVARLQALAIRIAPEPKLSTLALHCMRLGLAQMEAQVETRRRKGG